MRTGPGEWGDRQALWEAGEEGANGHGPWRSRRGGAGTVYEVSPGQDRARGLLRWPPVGSDQEVCRGTETIPSGSRAWRAGGGHVGKEKILITVDQESGG